MQAQVRLTLDPNEFDLVRAALDLYRAAMFERGNDASRGAPERRSAKAETVRTDDLLSQIRS